MSHIENMMDKDDTMPKAVSKRAQELIKQGYPARRAYDKAMEERNEKRRARRI